MLILFNDLLGQELLILHRSWPLENCLKWVFDILKIAYLDLNKILINICVGAWYIFDLTGKSTRNFKIAIICRYVFVVNILKREWVLTYVNTEKSVYNLT